MISFLRNCSIQLQSIAGKAISCGSSGSSISAPFALVHPSAFLHLCSLLCRRPAGDHSNNGLRTAASSVHALLALAYQPIRLPEASLGFRLAGSAISDIRPQPGLSVFCCHQLLSLVHVSGRKDTPQGGAPPAPERVEELVVMVDRYVVFKSVLAVSG